MNGNYLFYINTSNLSEDNYKKIFSFTSSYRKEKTNRYKNINDKKLSLCAELLLRYAFYFLDIKSHYTYQLNSYGKPYLNDCDIFFNISHCKDYVICAISNNEVGCDIELVKEPNIVIAKRFFSEIECRIIKQLKDKEDISSVFYRYWTLKESFIKNIGLGLSLPLNEFTIILNENIRIIQNINNNLYYFEEINIDSHYKCSLCKLNSIKTNLVEVKEKEIIDLFETCFT